MSVSAPNTCTDEQLDEVIVSSMASAGDSSPINNVTDDSIEEENLGEYKENYVPPHSIGSNSCLTEVTDQGEEEDGVGFDMSNRARLPRGIENIRPHLRLVDNVPLQVSLFTECNSDLTRQMLEIMQEYEQIICVVGSCANNENFAIFSQADISIAIEPLYPQVCQRIPVLPQHSTMSTESHTIRASTKLPQQFILNNSACSDKEKLKHSLIMEGKKFPHQMAHILNSVPCCLILNREKSITIASYIMEARLLMQRFWSCVQYWLCSVTFLSLLQFCSFLFFFPPILSLDGVVFLILIIVPVLSTSLVGTGFVDSKILRQATSRNHNNFNIETTFYILWCYGFKFLPSLISCILFHFTLLSSNCHLLYSNSSSLPVNTTSSLFGCNSDNAHPSSSSHQWLIESSSQFRVLSSIQQLQLCLVIIHLCLISYSFVYRDYNVWTSRHYSNALWRITSSIILTGAALYAILMYTTDELVVMATGHVILFTLSGLLVFLVCEFIKLQEIEKNVRYQKRARLDFDTKLGMNSPF
uniref:Transmembrane protein 94 n=1 Tax=Cacopsylla melanoneura TaxID=428564 RepID=A0A8D8RZI7_9HEMI